MKREIIAPLSKRLEQFFNAEGGPGDARWEYFQNRTERLNTQDAIQETYTGKRKSQDR